MHVNQIYYSDHFRIHTDMESLSYRLETIYSMSTISHSFKKR